MNYKKRCKDFKAKSEQVKIELTNKDLSSLVVALDRACNDVYVEAYLCYYRNKLNKEEKIEIKGYKKLIEKIDKKRGYKKCL